MMDHRKARERAWVVFIVAAVVLAGGRAYGNPTMIPALMILNGPFSFFVILLCIVIEYFFLQKIQGFDRKRSMKAALLMNAASAIPGVFFSDVLNEELYRYFYKLFERLYSDYIYDFYPAGPKDYYLVIGPIVTFPAMLALNLLIEGAVLRYAFKMQLTRRNLLILTAANTLTLALLYAVMVAHEIIYRLLLF